MAGTSPKEKFDAAVKVIQSLPKNVPKNIPGSFQPSHELMLRFYGYYKQATQGPCHIGRPAFWDIVGKAKWDAWNKLGRMSRSEAMLSYVDELKKIVEAMPHTEAVTEFLVKLGEFYEVVEEDPEKSPFKSLSKEKKQMAEKMGIPLPDKKMNGDVPHDGPAKPEAIHESDISTDSESPSSTLEEELLTVEKVINTDAMELATTPMLMPMSQGGKTSTPDNSAQLDLQPNGFASISGMHTNGKDSILGSDSETEEFCDTSDLPDLQPLQTEHSMLADQYIMTDALLQQGAPLLKAGQQGYPPHKSSDNNNHWAGNENPNQDYLSSPQSGDRQWSAASFTSPSSYGSVVDALTSRGGGDSLAERQPVTLPRSGSSASIGSQGRGGTPGGHPPSRRGQHTAAGGGGGRDPSFNPGPRLEVSEQIAVALVRLQQDMNSVLTRLHTLEALSVAHHQLSRSRQNSESDRQQKLQAWWWPFGNVSGRTVFFLMVWPFMVHWILNCLAKRRERMAFVDQTDQVVGGVLTPKESLSGIRGVLEEIEGLMWCALERGHPKWRRR